MTNDPPSPFARTGSHLIAIGLGALAMYFLDPDRGRRRRALVADQVRHAGYVLADATSVTTRDVAHRARGWRSAIARPLRTREISDQVIEGRVRTELGRFVSHPHAVKTTVANGHLVVEGPILAREATQLLVRLASVRGVASIENRLALHEDTAHISALQGGETRRGRRFELLQDSWSPTARLATGVTGSALLANALAHRGPLSAVLGLLGMGLVIRATTNHRFAELLGASGAIEIQKSIHIDAPIERVYEFWTDYRSFPRFMSHVRDVQRIDNERSHWTVGGPLGMPIEWVVRVTSAEVNHHIAWETEPGSKVRHRGMVRFEPHPRGGTSVHIRLAYLPPAGELGHVVARLLGADPKHEMDDDLMRMKAFIETGHVPRDAAQRSTRARLRSVDTTGSDATLGSEDVHSASRTP
jgi:uncharacterized membrane protein